LANTQPTTFAYVDLNEVDPNFKAIDADVYDVQILKAELKTFEYKTTTERHAAGDPGQFVKFTLSITNHPTYSGRRLFESLFEGGPTMRFLRKIMDATGVPQQPGAPIDEWLNDLTEIKPIVRVPVEKVPDVDRNGTARSTKPDGSPEDKNVVRWANVGPAN